MVGVRDAVLLQQVSALPMPRYSIRPRRQAAEQATALVVVLGAMLGAGVLLGQPRG